MSELGQGLWIAVRDGLPQKLLGMLPEELAFFDKRKQSEVDDRIRSTMSSNVRL
jgi:hypothetical protein